MDKKTLKIHNKSDKPDNIIKKEHEINALCKELEAALPGFLRGFHVYLKGNVLPMTRLAYLYDIRFFCQYLIAERSDLTAASKEREIALAEFNQIKAVDINMYIDYCRSYEKETEHAIYVYENNNKTLARKRSSVSVMFKYLYREELLEKNITDGFDPIKVPKPGNGKSRRCKTTRS